MIQAVVKIRCNMIGMEALRSFTRRVVWHEGPVFTDNLIRLIRDGAGWARWLAWILTRHGETGWIWMWLVLVDERECSALGNEIK